MRLVDCRPKYLTLEVDQEKLDKVTKFFDDCLPAMTMPVILRCKNILRALEELDVKSLLVRLCESPMLKTNAGDSLGKSNVSLLHAAILLNLPDVVKLLIQNGADVNHCDCTDTTAMHFLASSNQNPEILFLLLENGALINCRESFFGETPLTLASKKPKYSFLNLLLENGANINIRNLYSYRDPFELAWAGGANPECLQLLVSSGGAETACLLDWALWDAPDNHVYNICNCRKHIDEFNPLPLWGIAVYKVRFHLLTIHPNLIYALRIKHKGFLPESIIDMILGVNVCCDKGFHLLGTLYVHRIIK